MPNILQLERYSFALIKETIFSVIKHTLQKGVCGADNSHSKFSLYFNRGRRDYKVRGSIKVPGCAALEEGQGKGTKG